MFPGHRLGVAGREGGQSPVWVSAASHFHRRSPSRQLCNPPKGAQLRQRAIPIVVALIASLAAVAPAAAKPGKAVGKNAAKGQVIIEGLTLAGTQFGTPSGQPTTVATDPLSIPVTKGDTFTYSTITCASAFPPWNSFGLHFEPDYPGVDEGASDQGASVRHEFQGTVTKLRADGTGKIRGTVTTYLCEGGVRTDQIVSRYKAKFSPTSATAVPLVGGGPVPTTGGLAFTGKFKIVDGTGRFEDLRGRGRMIGQFTCLPQSLTRNAKSSCTALGGYSEVPFQLSGRYRDPTVPGA